MIDQRAAQGSIQLLEALEVALVADPHLVHAPVGLEPEPLGHLAPLVVGGDAVLAAQLLDQLEELVEVDVRVPDARGAVDRRSTVVHVLVQLCNCVTKKICVISVVGPVPDSVADPGCLSRVPRSEFFLSRIPDPGSASKHLSILTQKHLF